MEPGAGRCTISPDKKPKDLCPPPTCGPLWLQRDRPQHAPRRCGRAAGHNRLTRQLRQRRKDYLLLEELRPLHHHRPRRALSQGRTEQLGRPRHSLRNKSFALLNGYYNIYKASDVSTIARSDFGMSGKITRVSPDRTSDLGWYLPQAVPYWPVSSYALAQSELLPVAAQPLHYPLYGTLLDLDGLRPDLLKAQVVALFGKAQKIAVAEGVNGLQFVPDNGATSTQHQTRRNLCPRLPLLPFRSMPTRPFPTGLHSLLLSPSAFLDSHGRPGSVTAPLNSFSLVATTKDDPTISEYAVVTSVADVLLPYPHTQIVLESNLTFAYERLTTTVNANVALATHGSSVTEILGSGSAATANQSFALKQTPLTFVAAAHSPPEASVHSTSVPVALSGKEVPTLFGQRGTGRLFARLNQPGGNASVLFGDSVEGATLPTGQNNIQAKYRIGIGAVGNVSQGAITTLMDRPLGVNGVINPEPATGGQDAASITDIRSDAPQTVLTLGRAVSIADYQNFASTFAGIAKAYALWTPAGPDAASSSQLQESAEQRCPVATLRSPSSFRHCRITAPHSLLFTSSASSRNPLRLHRRPYLRPRL